jgi:hypothetical protein
MMYLTVAFILLVVFAYFATYIDHHLEIYSLGWTFIMGIAACLLWPLTLGLAVLIGPLVLVMRLGAKHRGDKI